MRAGAVMKRFALILSLALAACSASETAPPQQAEAGENWTNPGGDAGKTRHSVLTDITPANVERLGLAWEANLGTNRVLEATPLVVDGVMYTAGPPGQVFAFDAKTGLQIWKYERKRKAKNPYESNPFNRGVAVLGNRVFVGTLDAALVALDARTGLPLWETQVADSMLGYSVTAAPLAVKDKVIVGVAGGEHGIRGFLDAYDAATGKRVWRFNTVAGPGEFGHDSWKGDSWKTGGSGTWLTGNFDPALNLVYWTTGNPGPDMDAEVRKGDNLFSCSVMALDADTGERKWHYQFTPGDDHDWDANQGIVLADLTIGGKARKALLQANRNGFFYALDRTNGEFLFAKPFVKQTWNRGFDKRRAAVVGAERDGDAGGAAGLPVAGGRDELAVAFLRRGDGDVLPDDGGGGAEVRADAAGV